MRAVAAPAASSVTTPSTWGRPSVAAMAAGVYVAGLLVALEPDLPLVMLAVFGGLAAALAPSRPRAAISSPLVIAGLAFVVSTGVSSAASADVWRSLRLSTPLLPGAFLLLLIAAYFEGERDLRFLYLVCSAVGLALAATILVAAWRWGAMEPLRLVDALGSPLLVVPNDSAFLAVVAPLSLALMFCDSHRAVRALGTLSILASAAAVGVLQSRIAGLSMVLGLACAAVAAGRRGALWWPVVVLVTALIFDAARGFPLLVKFAGTSPWNPRLALWLAALAMVLDAPLIGHGPHSFGVLYRSHLDALRLPSWLPIDSRVVPWPHNLFLELGAEQGIVGLSVVVLLLASGLAVAWRTCHSPRREPAMLAAGAVAGLVAFCVAAAGELTLLRHWVVVTLMTLTGIVACLSTIPPTSKGVLP